MRSIGDAAERPSTFRGNTTAAATTLSVAGTPHRTAYCNICNPFEYQANYPSIRADHMRDVTDLFTDLTNGNLPAVSYVKPDGAMDGHPASSKFDLFEAFVDNIVKLAQSNKEQWAETAILITVDEGGGYYDFGIHPAGRFLRHGPAHSDDRRFAFLDRRPYQPRL